MKLYLVIALCLELVYARLPEGLFQKCDKNDRPLTKCLLNAMESIRPTLIKGIPDIDFPPLEPFEMKKLALESWIPGFKLSGWARNIVAHGSGDYQIKDFTLDVGAKSAKALVTIPELTVDADYITQGSKLLMLFNADSKGKFHGVFKNLECELSATGDVEKSSEDDLDYIRLKTLKVIVRVGRGSTVKVTPDNGRLAANVASSVISWVDTKTMLWMLRPMIAWAAAPIIKRYINNVLAELPIQDIVY